MGSITRRPTPPGPITDLFERLNRLHLNAGEPSLRRIVAGIGRGVISYTTVYNVLSGPRVPAWSFLKLIVIELGGDPDEFQLLWSAARQAERDGNGPLAPPVDHESRERLRPAFDVPTIRGPALPLRSAHFTAREAELRRLQEGFTSEEPRIQVLYGQGGVGKTELVVVFAHVNRAEYDIIWLIRAENEHLIRESLVELGHTLQLHHLRDGHSDHLVETTLQALRSGFPYRRSLIIFDDAPRPETIARYLPGGSAHVLVTTQSSGWRHREGTDVLEILEFTPAEGAEYLVRRVPGLTAGEPQVIELATALTGLPLALEHAAAYLNETGTTAAEYLELYRRWVLAMLDPDIDFSYPHAVVLALAISQEALSDGATALLRLFVMISPEPIAQELLVQPALRGRWPAELAQVLSDSRSYRQTVRELDRFSLVRFSGARNDVQMHRVAHAVFRRALARDDPLTERRYRRVAHELLAGSDPAGPEREENEVVYDWSYPHLVHCGAVTSDLEDVRRLVINQVRRLHLRGRHSEAWNLAHPTVLSWRRRLGAEHPQTLEMATELSIVLRRLGLGSEAAELTLDTMRRLRTHFGTDNEIFLKCARNHSTNLRFMARYGEAQRIDEELLPLYVSIFGEESADTLNLVNNIAIGLRCLGMYGEALEWDQRAYRGRAALLGSYHMHTLDSRFAFARDLRRLGRYEDSLDELNGISRILERRDEPESLTHLLYALDLGIALRRYGHHQEALDYGEMTLQRHDTLVGPLHQQALAAATNLITDRRIMGDLDGARELGERTVRGWTQVVGTGHPNTISASANLAVVRRLSGEPDRAREADKAALAGLAAVLGREHPHCIVVMANLASDLSASGLIPEACVMGERALALSRRVHSETHPFTLAIAANLALDLQAAGDESGDGLHAQTVAHYQARLPTRHPEISTVTSKLRVDLDVEIDHT